MISWSRIDHVQLPIPPGTEPEARKFYGGILGFEQIPKPASLQQNGGCWFRAGEIELHLGVEASHDQRSKQHVALEVANLLAVREGLEAHDVVIQEETPIPGRERFSFRDPFGNRIEVIERTS
ncbi:VOC family protein [Haladaptatus sp. GCM10025707]|uniref:VOC family protein n=1 Tax=unclassified Haladaptatus TaxID=2622732 RepID=UPI0023E7F8EF|nr:VOC family protein [Haladaptatus sp. QDMS2]